LLLSLPPSCLQIIPQNYRNNKRPLIPLWNQRVSVVVGEPFSFDLPSLRQQAKEAIRLDASPSAHSSSSSDNGSSSTSRSMSDSRHTSHAASDAATFPPHCQQERQSTATSPPASLDPTWRAQQPTFGADALIHSPEVLTQRLQELMQRGERSEQLQEIDHRLEVGAGEGGGEARIVNEERMEEGREEAEREAEAAALRRRIGNVMAVGSEETRRMYAHMMEDVRQRLEAVVMEAHDRQQCMK
ncbi:unnamed protein product, partial [Closterium sp. NIES-53]